MKASENLYLNSDKTEVVDESSPEQAFLLVIEGNDIPEWAVEEFGLTAKSQTGKAEAKPPAKPNPLDDTSGAKKADEKANKSTSAPENKSK